MQSRCIWQQGEHNAFTDLIAWQGALWCVFREAQAHVSPDGAFRVLRSTDHGDNWHSIALVKHPQADLRDPKFSCHPDGRLLLLGAGVLHDKSHGSHQSYVWSSDEGITWSEALPVGEPNDWLWRLTWHGQQAYALAYYVGRPSVSRLYLGDSTLHFKPHQDIYQGSYANENSLLFQQDNTALCLLRRDPDVGLLGRSTPPYTDWHWQALTARIGGPEWVQLADNRLLACVRLYDTTIRTSLCWIDCHSGKLTEYQTLPSAGDCSYAGMVLQDAQLFISYYSSHEGRTAIYFAKIPLSELPANENRQ